MFVSFFWFWLIWLWVLRMIWVCFNILLLSSLGLLCTPHVLSPPPLLPYVVEPCRTNAAADRTLYLPVGDVIVLRTILDRVFYPQNWHKIWRNWHDENLFNILKPWSNFKWNEFLIFVWADVKSVRCKWQVVEELAQRFCTL